MHLNIAMHLLLFNLEMKTFQFKCLSRVIPKILKPVIERLRSLGVYLVVCMDDIYSSWQLLSRCLESIFT